MIKIEVTGNSIPEVADKLLAIGASLRKSAIIDGVRAVKAVTELIAAEETVFEPSVGNATKSAPTATEQALPSTLSAASTDTHAPAAANLNFDTDVAPHVLALVKAKDKATAAEVLSQFGVEKASLLDPARWPELVVALKGAV